MNRPLIFRIFLFTALLIAGILSQPIFQMLLLNTFGYSEPVGSFGALYGLETAFLGLLFSYVFWTGVFLGIMGRKMDYIFIVCVTAIAYYVLAQEGSIPPQMYLGLLGVALLSNAIGYLLKLARLRWLKNLKI